MLTQTLTLIPTLNPNPNPNPHQVPEGVPLQEAFSMADEILRQGITGISDIVVKPGLINVDFADVRSVRMNER